MENPSTPWSDNATVAVVITTYNNPRTLELCLLTLAQQTFQRFDVFIADDGSGDETRDLIAKIKRQVPFMVFHYWHPDQGYRKSVINNRVFSDLDPKKYPLIVCLDHDVVVHPQFIEDHVNEHRRAMGAPLLFMGRRIDLDPTISASLNSENVCRFAKGFSIRLLLAGIFGKTKNVFRSVRMDLSPALTRLLKRDRVWDLLGSNFSISTDLLKAINGYNEDFQSYWGEDGDLFVRVRNSGAQIRGRIGYAVQWHLYHDRIPETPEHIQKYQELIDRTDYTWCTNGLKKSGQQ